MVYTLSMWLILGILLSSSVFALETFEEIKNVKILKVLPRNVVLLNRGLEDGINKNEHVKIVNVTEGFSSRAICLKAGYETSYWQLYRIPNSEAFSQNYSYTLVGIEENEIPAKVARVRDEIYEFEEEKKRADPGPNPFLVKRDLPEKLSERDLIDTVGPEKRKLFIEQAINRDQLERDLRDYRVSFYASPFSKQSINEGENLRYGVRGGNIASKYRLLTHFEQQQSKLKDPLTEETVSTRSTTGQAQFIIHRITPGFSSLSLINYNSARFSRLATPKSHWQVGFIGATWHLFESDTWEHFDLSYLPLYDVRKTEVLRGDGSVDIVEKTGLRHGMRLAARAKINERVSFENTLWVKPFQELSSWELHTNDLNLSNDLKLIFSITDHLFFDYNLVYVKDRIWAKLSDLPESNTINSVNVRYDFEL